MGPHDLQQIVSNFGDRCASASFKSAVVDLGGGAWLGQSNDRAYGEPPTDVRGRLNPSKFLKNSYTPKHDNDIKFKTRIE
jgi:hypothetical protein